jgi:hypothetical protein
MTIVGVVIIDKSSRVLKVKDLVEYCIVKIYGDL